MSLNIELDTLLAALQVDSSDSHQYELLFRKSIKCSETSPLVVINFYDYCSTFPFGIFWRKNQFNREGQRFHQYR